MEKDLKNNTKLIQRSSESLTIFIIGSKRIKMNEMAIGRAKKFVILITEAAERVKEKLNPPTDRKGGIRWNKLDLKALISEGGDILFQEATVILNFLFDYHNDNFEPLTVEWVENNMSLRILKEILLEVAKQNQMSWLPPFFQSKFSEVLMK